MTHALPSAHITSGQPITRVDGQLKVTGRAAYAADNHIAGVVYAVLVCSTVGSGGIERIETRAATGLPEVLRVFTDFTGLKLPFDARQVSFFGQPVAVVVATTLEAATQGASLVTVRYAAHPALTNIDAAQAVPQPGRNTRDYVRGDPEHAIRDAAVVTDLEFSIARNNHNPMELPATVASWDGDRLTVWDKVQSISSARQNYAKALGIPPEDVRVLSPFVGGAFGSAGQTWPHQVLAAFAARRMQRPVKLVLTRKQMYSGIGYRPTSRQRLAIGADRNGRIGAMIHEGRTETAKYETYEDGLVGNPRFMYRIPSVRSTYRIVRLDVNLPTYMRGPGAVTGMFALESAMDDLAHRLGIDPIELRMRNEPDIDQTSGTPFSTRRLTECLTAGAATFGWNRRNPVPAATRDGDRLVGMGVAAAAYHTSRSQCAAAAKVLADGTAEVRTGTSDMGPGTYTSMTQVAADALGLPLSRVRFALGDSLFPPAPSHSGSRTMASVGSAVFTATSMLRDKLIRMAVTDPASPLSGLRPQDVTVADGRLFATAAADRGESYQDLLRRRGWPELEAEQTWTPDDADKRYSMYAYGAVFAEVAVDSLLATVRIRRIYACYDAGRVINPKLAHSQAIGGMVGGIGMALLEATELDHRDGRIVNANMADYLVPVNADVPALDATFLAAEDTIADPIGVKGLGELVIVGVPAAIANAVFNATGRRVTDLPITVEKLL
ncbi:oxidoreductase [Mycobacterium kubicae]|uniref:Oxidoreductase n=1 Tax=Mycobacterium kubicae TaxID=120959 RepID=A0AAX1JG59_9MYCO|nr:xanthine dehydrogenase family protein molybdopterin-binding subunit [Mycobacterium kubicae]MCV7093628.1 xanthine dehydrogenase family protein molybdopterin-binding subunit [Mycobacterium kubicae]ORV96087.1 acylaldehyde oxidase [Mycobacterium kubicae]QNI11976.1 xanthine dehydrogenase family protein molybdopterin-binding subunit [Mycobacterium kubicae]QPI40201.1 xanthine dehydrogenase family protein molybdopterin-binding subunit [Mycobacterium kubicae]GFG64924.1 oxidoreductase [Mycobacterium 